MNKFIFSCCYILFFLTMGNAQASVVHLYSQPDVTAPLLIEIDSKRSPLKHMLFYETIDGVDWYSAEWVQADMLQMIDGYVPLSALNKQGELLTGTQIHSEPTHASTILTVVHPGNQFHIKSVKDWLYITLEQYPIVYFYEVKDFPAESLALNPALTNQTQLALLKDTLDSEMEAITDHAAQSKIISQDVSIDNEFLRTHTKNTNLVSSQITKPSIASSNPPTISNHTSYQPGSFAETIPAAQNGHILDANQPVPIVPDTAKNRASVQLNSCSNDIQLPVRYLEGIVNFTRSPKRLKNGHKIHYSLVDVSGTTLAYVQADNKLIDAALSSAKNQKVMIEGLCEVIDARSPLVIHATHVTQNNF